MKKILKRIALLLLIVFIVMQFFGPDKNVSEVAIKDNPSDFITIEQPSAMVEGILVRACYDCHSNNTTYPWYNNITPVNYWMADHVAHGTKHLNFSEWGTYSPKKKDHKLEECIEMVEEGEMPLNSYTWTHGDAKLTQAEIQELTTWLSLVRLKVQKQMPK